MACACPAAASVRLTSRPACYRINYGRAVDKRVRLPQTGPWGWLSGVRSRFPGRLAPGASAA